MVALSSQISINRTLPWEKCSPGQKVRSEQSIVIRTESGLCVARSGNKKVKFAALVIQDYDYTITMVHKTAENHMFVCGTDGTQTTCCNMVGGSSAVVNLLQEIMATFVMALRKLSNFFLFLS